ncbi:MAG: hypothetical protein WC121_10955 [Candidatus Kapaibacterium sp.]
MLINRTEEVGYFLGEVVPENLPKLIAKLETEDFAILKSTTKDIRKEIVEMGYRCYILSMKSIEDDSTVYMTLVLKNKGIKLTGEPFADSLGIPSFLQNNVILVDTGSFWVLSEDGNSSQYTNYDKSTDLVSTLEQCYTDEIGDGRTFKLQGVKSPINNLSRMAMSTLNISWM